MGLCKCPKRKVTNQFCFEHRVCVCEHCMITNHPTCVVQSYLQWLQDSDYNSTCELCSKELTTDDSIRLTCYHIFHWSCLDHYSRQLPPTTAPGGYLCPSEGCKTPLFPTPNLVSPIADVLKEKLAGVNWARSGLGLPLLSEEREVKKSISTQNSKMIKPPQTNSNINGPPNTHSVVNVDEENQAFNRNTDHDMYQSNSSNRRFQEQRDVNKYVQFDHDDDKYKRRPVSELMRNWWRLGSNTRGPQSLIKKYLMLGFIILFAVVIVLMFLSKMSKTSDYDPTYDEFQQQFVRVNDKS